MVSKVTNSRDAYVQQRFSQLPNAEKGEAHVIKKGESLWNIAKSELGDNAKKSEINDYMLQLAKLNGLDSVEKMNNIKVNTTIYLPKKTDGAPLPDDSPLLVQPKKENTWLTTPLWSLDKNDEQNPFSPTKWWQLPDVPKTDPAQPAKPAEVKPKSVTKPTPAVKPKPAADPKPVQDKPAKVLNPVEKTFADRINTVMSDPSVKLQKALMTFIGKDVMYHVMNHHVGKSGYVSNSHPVMSFVLRENGHIDCISFEGENDVNKNGYDYHIKYDGKNPATISTSPYISTGQQKVGTVSAEDMQKLENRLKSLIK